MKYKKQHLFLALVFYAFLGAFCQSAAQSALTPEQYILNGTVKDSYGPLPGVHVLIKGTNTGTFTDKDGEFSLTVTATNTLVFSYLGYHIQELSILGRIFLEVELRQEATQLQEVKVNAGYYTVKERERTGSISRVTAEEIELQPVINPLAALQGRMPGVNIVQNTGVPGGGFQIRIRGQNSLRDGANEPLYIIDGIPYSSDGIGSNSTSGVLAGISSPMNSLNPDNIASIEVLKDADATAIYGSRGANGVVLITTKKGREGKAEIFTSYSYGLGKVTRFMDLMNTQQFLAMRREAYSNDGFVDYPISAYDVNGTWNEERYTDWQEELTGGLAEFINLNAGISGGSERNRFLLSGNFLKQTTVFNGDFQYTKGNIHLGAEHKSKDQKLSISFSGIYTVQDNNLPYMDLTYTSRKLPPNAPVLYQQDGSLNWENNTFENPLSVLEGEFKAETRNLIASSVISYRPIKELELKYSLGYTDLRHLETSSAPSSLYNPAFGIGPEYSAIFLANTDRRSWIMEPQINWQTSFGNLAVNLLVGSTFQHRQNNGLGQLAMGFPSNNLIYNLRAASSVQVTAYDRTTYRYQATFGRVNLNWKERYIVNLTGRRDGSSRFGPGKQFSSFGAIGAAWIFSKEPWIEKSLPFLTFGKLRGSYGTTGNDQIGDYQYLDTYAATGSFYEESANLIPTRLFNADFGWEMSKKLELALEAGLFQNSVFLTAAWYRNRSSNQLVGIPLPATTGFSSVQANLDATVENRGLEMALRTVNIRKTDFTWITDVNFTASKNELLSFPNLEGSTYRNKLVIGKPLNIEKAYRYLGIDAVTGIYGFEDFNHDGAITSPDDKQIVKDMTPAFYGGVQNQFSYKQLRLDILFQFVEKEARNAIYAFGMPGQMTNQLAEVSDRWQGPGTASVYQMYSTGVNALAQDSYLHYQESDAAISDASFIRLKNISLSYNIPNKWIFDAHCRVFVRAENLLTITSYNGADPEFISLGKLPPLKMVTTGIELRF